MRKIVFSLLLALSLPGFAADGKSDYYSKLMAEINDLNKAVTDFYTPEDCSKFDMSKFDMEEVYAERVYPKNLIRHKNYFVGSMKNRYEIVPSISGNEYSLKVTDISKSQCEVIARNKKQMKNYMLSSCKEKDNKLVMFFFND